MDVVCQIFALWINGANSYSQMEMFRTHKLLHALYNDYSEQEAA